MPLFGHGHEGMPESPGDAPALAAAAQANGWKPSPAQPFDGHLVDRIHEMTRILYGASRQVTSRHDVRVGSTVCTDAYRGSIGSRAVMVANAWTAIEPGTVRDDWWRGMAVCAAELGGEFPIACLQPRRFPPLFPARETPTGNAAFDEQYRVYSALGTRVANRIGMGTTVQQVLTPDLQLQIRARDDCIFFAEEYLLACVSMGSFQTSDEVMARIRAVMGVVTHIPASVVPQQVDHSYDDLLARVNALKSVDDALALIQSITPEQREQLARSNTPLAPFADVRTPDEAMERLGQLPIEQQHAVGAMFEKVNDQKSD